ncbi:STAS domain-containing protein [Streptomyces sp. NPDC089919]|uniref:STAS domain-containing protein n=1 Tax=Streptomyces sp. NPDC089919 TaxID=3155188 RepID=UPI003413706C
MHGDDETGRSGIESETRDDGSAVVRPRGEMDIDGAAAFRRAVLEALVGPPRPPRVVVDLQDLSFCDSSGLNALLEARNAATEHGQALHLAAPRDQLLRLLELTCTTELFTIDPVPPL